MKSIRFQASLLAGILLLAASCSGNDKAQKIEQPTTVVVPSDAVKIPVLGNIFVTSAESERPSYSENESAILTSKGEIMNWTDPTTVLSLYFKTSVAGDLNLWINATAGTSDDDKSTIKITVDGTSHTIDLKGGRATNYDCGSYAVKTPGYVKIDIQGVSKSGPCFGKIEGIAITGAAAKGELHYGKYEQTDDAYWTRRGPSVHMNYTLPADNIEYFYNEVTVPEGSDVNGTYFMLTGFGEGYMGIQSITGNNGENANKVLFSVWSPYNTDNPNEIPESLHVKILAKGDGVTAQNFGNEGSGKQSFMDYPWKTGQTYKTLVKVTPDGKGNTVYTGYFGDEKGEWHLLSSLLRPQTDTWYTRPHSFLECFNPALSYKPRSVVFGNQWVRDNKGTWHEITDAVFTCDNTGNSGARTDFNGGVRDNSFYLQNCGFVNENTPYRSQFKRSPEGRQPDIDFEALDRLTASK